MIRPEADLDGAQSGHGSQHQARAHHQHQRRGHFQHHQRVAGAGASAADAAAAALLERVVQG